MRRAGGAVGDPAKSAEEAPRFPDESLALASLLNISIA